MDHLRETAGNTLAQGFHVAADVDATIFRRAILDAHRHRSGRLGVSLTAAAGLFELTVEPPDAVAELFELLGSGRRFRRRLLVRLFVRFFLSSFYFSNIHRMELKHTEFPLL